MQKAEKEEQIMLYYVAHCYGGDLRNFERARRITHELQISDLQNTYICPLLAFSFLEYNELGFEAEMDLCIDLLSACDVLLVVSKITKGVQCEIDFARQVGMEVQYIET